MDLVFIDAPCTGSGSWRRHPDTKWRLTPEQLARRMADQDMVLDAGAPFVKPGGRMIYVTCSVFVEENEDRVAAFLARNPGFSLAGQSARPVATLRAKAPDDVEAYRAFVLSLSETVSKAAGGGDEAEAAAIERIKTALA